MVRPSSSTTDNRNGTLMDSMLLDSIGLLENLSAERITIVFIIFSTHVCSLLGCNVFAQMFRKMQMLCDIKYVFHNLTPRSFCVPRIKASANHLEHESYCNRRSQYDRHFLSASSRHGCFISLQTRLPSCRTFCRCTIRSSSSTRSCTSDHSDGCDRRLLAIG